MTTRTKRGASDQDVPIYEIKILVDLLKFWVEEHFRGNGAKSDVLMYLVYELSERADALRTSEKTDTP